MKAIVFDLDGTLVDSVPDMQLSLNEVMADQGLEPFSIADVRSYVGNGVPVLIRKAMAARRVEGEAVFDRWHAGYLEAYARNICVETCFYPGVENVLEALSDRPLAICTNKPQNLADDLLARLGIDSRFQVILGGDTAIGRKPDAAPLRHVAAQMGVAQAVMVGDSMADSGAAAAAGWPLLLYTQGYRDCPAAEIPATARFDDWADFLTLLRGLDQAA